MTETLTDLELQLREKEQVIEALTERLEQAAEQLDRIRRTGADRGARVGGGGGLPPELIEQQKTLTEELQQALQQWDTMQAGATLGRIEIQLTELRDLVAGGMSTDHASAPVSRVREPRPQRQPSQAMALGGSGGYERLKAELLGDPEEPAPEPVAREHVPQHEIEPATELAAAPQPVDRSDTDPESLHAAIDARDEYIASLIRRVRSTEARAYGPIDWNALADAPEEMRQRLEQLSRSLDERLRMAEVELSLERARLSREEARLRMAEQQIEKEKRRLAQAGTHIERPAPTEHAATDKGGRWRKLLGMGSGEGA